MVKRQQSSSLHKPDLYPIPKSTPLFHSYDIPAPVIICSKSDPYPFLNSGQSLIQCNVIPKPVNPVINHSRSDPCQKLNPVSPLDIDPWIASRSETEVVARITYLTASEHAGGTLGEPTTIVSTTSSHSSANSKVGDPQTVKDVFVTKVERKNDHFICCDLCNVICNSQKAFKSHMGGKTHLKNTRKRPVTSPINQETPLPVADQISDQYSNKKNEGLLQNEIPVDSIFYCSIPELGCANQDFRNIVAEQVTEPMCLDGFKPSNGHEKLDIRQPMWCDVCKVSCSSDKCFQLHISGKQHLKNIKDSEKNVAAILPSTLCELCGISCSSRDDLNRHISGKKHQKNLKKAENFAENGLNPATQHPKIEEGEVSEESNKRKANISSSSDDVDKKKPKMMEEDVRSGVFCKLCNVVCKGIMAFDSHLASFEHFAMVQKQDNPG